MNTNYRINRLVQHANLYGIACYLPGCGWAIEYAGRDRSFHPDKSSTGTQY
jgi:hypothetical protein